jgi:hypothetical protein
VANASGGGSTIQDPEGSNTAARPGEASTGRPKSTVIAAVIRAVVGSLGGAYLGVSIGADRDDERANREFLRTQRIALYGDYPAAVDETRVLMEPVLPPSQPDGSPYVDLPYPSQLPLRLHDRSTRRSRNP